MVLAALWSDISNRQPQWREAIPSPRTNLGLSLPKRPGGADLNFKRPAVLVTIVTLLAPSGVWTAELPDAQIRTTTVAAFKNGLGFFIRQGQVRLAGGEGRILSVPAATLGTLWLAPNDPGATLEELVAFEQQTKYAAPAVSLAELLHSNPGKLVTVYSDGRDITGEIVGFAPPTSASASPSGERGIESSAVTPPASEALLLRTADGRVVGLHLNNVAQVSFPKDSALEVTRTEVAAALRFKINGAQENAHLTMGYLRKGFGWTPSYLVTLEDEKTARILMQAVVTNDAEDLQDADLFFVVGVPNFRYSEILSPMVLQQALAQAMSDFRGGGMGRGVGGGVGAASLGALNGQISVSERNAFEGDRSDADLRAAVAELEGAPEEDLFLYHRPRVTLARGERATYNVFNGTVAYEHIYEWDIPDTTHVDPYGNAQYNAASPVDRARETTNDIWHSLRLTNGTQFPWTSAPALTLSANQPLAQDTLAYTPRGAHTNLKITIATDVRPHREELEVDRQIDALHAHGYSYDAVTVEGTVKVKNYKAKAIRLLIGKTLTGSVLSVTDEGKSKRLAVAVQAENPTSQINWDLKFQPAEEKTVTYRYKVLVRR